jgi:hypothetical protein
VPTLKVKFNDAACEYYEKKRRHWTQCTNY